MKKPQSNNMTIWPQRLIVLIVLSVLANHLTDESNFPFSETYQFPILDILISFAISSLLVFIADQNFKYYRDKYFNQAITTATVARFIATTMGYIVALYIITYLVTGYILGDDYEIFLFLIGLTVTLLLCTIGLFILYGRAIWVLHKQATTEGKLTVRKSGKTIPIPFAELSYLYSQDKVVYAVSTDGRMITTDFTLSEVEGQLNTAGFFHANRQTILHKRSISKLESIANGQVSVVIQPTILGLEEMEIVVSRYKKQAFMEWFENNG